MKNKGIDREAVELVVITHLHPDHVGWNLTNGQPTFPNASYLVPDTVATPGHTPGHVSIAITSAGENAFILGDVAHSPAQAHRTEWNPGFDINGDISRETRRLTIDRLESNNIIVSAGHFPNPGFGRFVRYNGIRIWDPISER